MRQAKRPVCALVPKIFLFCLAKQKRVCYTVADIGRFPKICTVTAGKPAGYRNKEDYMERKLGIVCECLPGVARTDALPLMAAAGFNCFFTELIDEKAVAELREKGDRLGLTLDFIHAPFRGINDFWKNNLDYLDLYNRTKQAIDAAAGCGCNMIVMHLSSGWTAPPITDIGLSRFDALVEYAGEKGVRIAFENIRKFGVLAAMMERYERVPHVGFCYDCGHEHCYTEDIRYLETFGKRLFCTHIHDNYGRDKEKPMTDADYHLLVGDGNLDFAQMMREINAVDYSGTLILEVGKKAPYEELSNEAYLKMAYDRLKAISELK